MALLSRITDHCQGIKAYGENELKELTEQVIKARVTKLEVLLSRTITKDSLAKPRKDKLMADQRAGYVKDMADWKITDADFAKRLWKPLAQLCGL
jgi:hypothetical protein